MIIAHWNNISKTKWNYDVDTELEFSSKRNIYGNADSAVALYWDPVTISPGGKRTIETYYGLGSFYTTEKSASYGLQIFAPTKLTLNDTKTGYLEKEFEIQVELDNSVDNAVKLSNVSIDISLPEELSLCEGEEGVKRFDFINAGETKTVTWKVTPEPQYRYNAVQYIVSVSADGISQVMKKKYIALPGINGEPPSIQVMDVTPNNLYVKDDEKSITVKGRGFSLLLGYSNWSVMFENNWDGAQYPIPMKDVVISNDENMYIKVDDSSWNGGTGAIDGSYSLIIDAGKYGKFRKQVTFTNDSKYRSRSYGILLVVGDKISPDRERKDEVGKETYSLVAVNSEKELEKLREEYKNTVFENDKQILLEFRGKIKEMQGENKKIYEIAPDAFINSAIHFYTNDTMKALFGEASQKIIVQKESGVIEISGNGILAIPSFPFVFGDFLIELKDGKRYSLEPDEEEDLHPIEIDWLALKALSVFQKISYFPVKIKNAVIGDKWVSFGGTLYLNFGARQKDKDDKGSKGGGGNSGSSGNSGDKKDDDEEKNADITASLYEARFGIKEKAGKNGEDTFGFIGLRTEGEVKLPKDLIPGLKVGAEGRIKIDTLDNIYEIEASMEFKVIEFYGLLTLRFTDGHIPIPDNILFAVGGEPGIPLIPPTPVAHITKGGGGFKNLYDTIMGNYNILPPLKVVLIGGLDIAKVLEADNMFLEISARGIEFSGEMKILKFPILKEVEGHFLVEDSLKKFGLSIGLNATMEAFDVLEGNVWLMFEYDSSKKGLFGPVDFGGGGRVTVKIPEKVRVVGGYVLFEVAAELSTKKVYAGVKILEIPISIEYYWGSSKPDITLFADNSGEFAEFMPLENSGLMSMVYYNEETGAPEGRLVIGSNIKTIASTKDGNMPKRPKKGVLLASAENFGEYMNLKNGIAYVPVILAAQDGTEHFIDIQNQEIALIELEYSGDVPKVEVYDPSGKKIELIKDENYLIQEIPADVSESGTLEQRMYISLKNPANGQWRIKTNRPVECTLMDVEIPPSLKTVSVEQTGHHSFRLNWENDHVTDEKIALYLCEDKEKDPGRKLVDNIDASLGTYEYTLPDSLATGEYYIRAVLYKDDTSYSSKYGEQSINIVNPNQPVPLSNVQLKTVGNGFVNVNWTPTGDVDGYYIQLLDENGNPAKGVGAVEVEGNQSEALIGGVFERENGEIIGLQPGHTYKVSIVAYRIIDDIKHFSEPAYSHPLYVPEPDPAKITLGIEADGEGTVKTALDDDGSTYYLVNSNGIKLSIDSDQQADMEIEVNGEVIKRLSGKSFTEIISLVEGNNVINVHAVNENGDYSVSSAIVVSDITPPELKIESPDINALASDNQILVKGVCEPGAVVKVDGQRVSLEEGGMFELFLSMDGLMQRDIVITAEDEAGNMTVYESSVINNSISQLTGVKIRLAKPDTHSIKVLSELPEDDDLSVEMGIGDTGRFELYGIDEAGNEYKIAQEDVRWSILAGEDIGKLTEDGLLEAMYEGDVIIKASYFVSEDYAFEDAMLVSIVKKKQGNGEEPEKPEDKEQWYITPDEPSKGTSAYSIVSARLSKILNDIIKREKGYKFLRSEETTGTYDTTLIGDDNMQLFIPAQDFQPSIGVGIGRIDDVTEFENDSIQICSSIYEIVLDRPVIPDKPFTLTLKPDKSKVGELSPEQISKLKIYWYNDILKRWEYLGGQYNSKTGTISVELTHFSKYALLYNEKIIKMEDIRGRPTEDAIYRLVSIGVVNGVPRGNKYYFEPERSVSRQEFAKLMVISTDVPMATMYDEDMFIDMDKIGSWAVPYVMAAVKRGWINGVPENGGMSIQPQRNISRSEAVTILGRILENAGIEKDENTELPYADSENIPSWSLPYVKLLYKYGVIAEYENNRFASDKPVSREEAAVMISRMIDALYFNGAKVE